MDCLNNVDGLGELCQQGSPLTIRTGAYLTHPDFSFVSLSSFLTEADWLTAIAAGNIYPLTKIMDQENQDMEDVVFESSTGDKVPQYEGTRGQMWKFILPLDLHKILKNQYSLKNWRIIELDKNGNLIATSPDKIAVQGFKLSYFRVLKQETPGSDNAAFTPIEFQKSDIKEYDVNGVYANPTWIASDLTGVLKITITPSTVAANVFTMTAAYVSTSVIDPDTNALKTFPITGLGATNLQIIDQAGAILSNAGDYTVTESAAVPGTYTIDATVGTITSGSVQVVASSTQLYSSAVATLTAA
jgi:hypothetical protein